MTWSDRLRTALSPPAQVTRVATGLTFTDILFGFVIRELFIRLQNWGELAWFVRWQLIASTLLVLGSWIGFRRSLNRSLYELKFFNLPLARFVLDQLMVILYFRIAVLTPTDPQLSVNAETVTESTMETLLFVFALYAVWDLLGILMAVANDRTHAVEPGGRARPKYPQVDRETENQTEPPQRSNPDWRGLGITVAGVLVFLVLTIMSCSAAISDNTAGLYLASAAVMLLVYRFAKEVKNSWRTAD